MSDSNDEKKSVTCGIVMPISATDGCSVEHWLEVRHIITEAVQSIKEYSFDLRMVNESDESGVIHKRIVQAVYSNAIVVCDLSTRNPNVIVGTVRMRR